MFMGIKRCRREGAMRGGNAMLILKLLWTLRYGQNMPVEWRGRQLFEKWKRRQRKTKSFMRIKRCRQEGAMRGGDAMLILKLL